MSQKTALFVGRFQPFHLGHLSSLKKIDLSPDISRILIGIGSSQEARTDTNPFTFREREQMITAAISKKLQKPFKIFGIQDMYDPKLWFEMVLLTSKETFSVIYSSNDWTRDVFIDRGFEVRHSVSEIEICATDIRHLIKGNKPFSHLVPPPIFRFIKSHPNIIN